MPRTGDTADLVVDPPTASGSLLVRKNAIPLYIGAVLSISDMTTDLIVVRRLFGQGNSLSFALMATICLNMFAQSFLCWIQNRRKSLGVQAREILYILTLVSPGVHAHRVAKGKSQTTGDFVSPELIMTYSKVAEIVGEAVPGLIIQLVIVLSSPDQVSSSQFISIAVSVATTAFGAVTLFFDKDTNPKHRSRKPSFYGAIKDDGTTRSITMFVLMLFTMCLVFMKCLGFALVWVTFGVNLAFLGWGCETIVFHIFKGLVERDFYWLPTESLVLSLIVIFIFRTAIKMMVDFTGWFQMRHAYELGGLVFSVSLFWSQLSTIVSAVLYVHYSGGSSKIDATVLYAIVGSLTGAWVVLFGAVLLLLKAPYRAQFFSTESASEHTIACFRCALDDAQKSDILFVQKRHWEGIKPEVIEWMHANWARWKRDKPEFFTDLFIESVADEFIPKESLEELHKEAVAGKRRRSSAGILSGRGGGGGASSKIAPESGQFEVKEAQHERGEEK